MHASMWRDLLCAFWACLLTVKIITFLQKKKKNLCKNFTSNLFDMKLVRTIYAKLVYDTGLVAASTITGT